VYLHRKLFKPPPILQNMAQQKLDQMVRLQKWTKDRLRSLVAPGRITTNDVIKKLIVDHVELGDAVSADELHKFIVLHKDANSHDLANALARVYRIHQKKVIA